MKEIAMVPLLRGLAFALMTSLVACTSTSQLPDSSVASQISIIEDALVVTRKGMDSSPQASERQPLPATLSEARSYLLEHSPDVRARLLNHQINLSNIAQNEGGYSNPAFSIGRFSLPSDGVKRLIEVGFSLTDLLGVPATNRALEFELALANLEFEAELFGQLLSLEQQWLDVGMHQARVELLDYHVRFLSAVTALSADYLAAGNISETEHLDRALALSAEERALNLANQALFSAKVQLAKLLGVASRSAMRLDVPLWDIQGDRIPSQDEALASAQAINRNLQAIKARIPLLENEVEKRRWMRWLQNVGLSYEVEDEDERQEGPKLEFDVPIFDTQIDLLKAQTKRANLGQLRVELTERELEFSVISLTRSLDELGRVIRRLQEETLPLSERRALLLQKEESYMLIDVFELAQARLDQIEQVDALLDVSHAYWLDRITLSHRMGLLLKEQEPLRWQDKLPGLQGGQMNHSTHRHHEMGHEMNHGSGPEPDLEGHGGHEMHESMHSSHGDAHSGMHPAAHQELKPDLHNSAEPEMNHGPAAANRESKRYEGHEMNHGSGSKPDLGGHGGHEIHESMHSSHGDAHSGMHPAAHQELKPDLRNSAEHKMNHGPAAANRQSKRHEDHEMHESMHSSHGDAHSGMRPAARHPRIEKERETPPPPAKTPVTEKKNGATHDH